MKGSWTNIVFISSEWNEYHRREFTEELYKKISIWSNVVLVQLPVSLLVHVFTNFRSKILNLFLGKFKTKNLQEKVYLFTPIILFHYLLWLKFKPFAYVDSILLKIQLNHFIKRKINSEFNILWLYFPQLYTCTNILNYNYLVYDFYDNYDYNYAGDIINTDSNYNEKLIEKSDFIICTARKLFEKAKALNINSFYIPNGNSFEKITHAANTNIDFTKKRKTIGYLGTYRNWINFELVEKLVEEFNEVDFLFIGSIHPSGMESFEKLKKNSNFYYIPPQQFEIAISYLKVFDVGIIPFRINKFTEGVFPNKFFEYAAAGIPIVTSALSDLKKYSNLIGYSESDIAFLDNVTKALSDSMSYSSEALINLARNNSWRKRTESLNDLLLKSLGIK